MMELFANLLFILLLFGIILIAIATIKDMMDDRDEIEFLRKLRETIKNL